MRVDTNLTFMARATQEKEGAEKEKSNKSGTQTIFAGSLQGDFSLQGRIQQKRERAQKRAMKVVNDAWNVDRKIDDEIDEVKAHIKELQQEKKAAGAEAYEARQEMERLRESYGVEQDSQEQKDLEILKKARAAECQDWSLSDEEKEYVNEVKEKGLTEYQERALDVYKVVLGKQSYISALSKQIAGENEVIRGIRQERRKIHPMVDAQEQAEDIIDAAEEEIVGMVVEDAKEHLDEEKEEREEQAEEIREEKEKQEEILDKREEKEDALEELMEELPVDKMLDIDQTMSEVKRQIQNILNELNLVTEDIKGSQVDASL